MGILSFFKSIFAGLIMFLVIFAFGCSLAGISGTKSSSSSLNSNTNTSGGETSLPEEKTNSTAVNVLMASTLTPYAVFPENFDGIISGDRILPLGWVTPTVDANTYIGASSDVKLSGSNSLKLYDASNIEVADANVKIADTAYGQLSFYFYIPTGSKEKSYFQLRGPADYKMINICFDPNGHIQVMDASYVVKNNLTSYSKDTWTKMEIKWDKSTGYFRVMINDKNFGNYSIMNLSQAITYLKFIAGNRSNYLTNYAMIYFDDVNLTNNQETIDPYAVFPQSFDGLQTGDRSLPNGWSTATVDANTYIGASNEIAFSSPNCLKLYDNSQAEVADANVKIIDTAYGLLKFSFYIPSGATEKSYFQLKGSSDYKLINICFDNGQVQIMDSSNKVLNIIGAYNLNEWSKMEFRWDKNSGYFKVFINGSNKGYYRMMNSSQSVKTLKFMAGNRSNYLNNYALIYLDDFSYSTNQINVVDVGILLDSANLPKFVSRDFCDLQEINQVSKFRSGYGHDYSDKFETNRSMKHYYEPKNLPRDNDDFKLYSPVDGVITMISNEGTGYTGGLRNRQVKITSDQYPGITFVIFHVNLLSEEIIIGKHVNAGEQIGYAQLIYLMPDGSEFNGDCFDIAVWASCFEGLRYVSYFDLLTDGLLNNYISRGAGSKNDFIITKEQRDSDPLVLIPGSNRFVTPGNIENRFDLN